MAFRHGQYICTHMVHFAHCIVAGFVLFKFHSPPVQFFNHGEAVLRIHHYSFLVDDPIVGDSDFLDVLVGRRVAGHHRLFKPSMPMQIAPLRLTLAFSSRSTRNSGLASLAFTAAMGPAVPPPMTSTSTVQVKDCMSYPVKKTGS